MLEVFKSNKMVKDPNAALMEIAEQIHIDDLGLFVTRDEKRWTGAVLCQLSRTAFNPACIVIHLYCKGSGKETRNELIQAVFNFAEEGGYNDIIAIDANNKSKGFGKMFEAWGTPTILGSMFHFDMTESLL